MRFTNLGHYQHEIHMNNYEMLLLLLDIIQSYTNIKATPNQAIKVLRTKHQLFLPRMSTPSISFPGHRSFWDHCYPAPFQETHQGPDRRLASQS